TANTSAQACLCLKCFFKWKKAYNSPSINNAVAKAYNGIRVIHAVSQGAQ
ncbi:conserved hypothetical protein, partial [Trichinella spiralis]